MDPRLDPGCTASLGSAGGAHPAAHQAQLSSITKILTHASNGVDSEQWPASMASAAANLAAMQYSAVYVPTTNNLVESSFSTTSTSDQALPSHYYHSSRSSSGGTGTGGRAGGSGSGGRRKNLTRCQRRTRSSRQQPPLASSNTRTISSSCSCSSCSSSTEDKENIKCSSPPLPVEAAMASLVDRAADPGLDSGSELYVSLLSARFRGAIQ